MRAAALAGLLGLGCATRRPVTAPPSNQPTPSTATVFDDVVVWPRALDTAPPAVRDRIRVLQLWVDALAHAGRPTIARDDDPAAWSRWYQSAPLDLAAFNDAITAWQAAITAGAPSATASMAPAEGDLFVTAVQLVEAHARARYLSELRLGAPVVSGCERTLPAAYGEALADLRRRASSCLELASPGGAAAASPLAVNLDVCRRRAAWAEAQLATGVDGVRRAHPDPLIAWRDRRERDGPASAREPGVRFRGAGRRPGGQRRRRRARR